MLKYIRKNAEALWVKAIFGGLAAIFVLWGVGGGIASSRKEEWVAKVNDESISPIDYARAYDSLYRLYESVYKDNFKPEIAKMLDLKNKAVDQLVRASLLRQEAEKIGIRASDAEVRDSIAEMKSFHSESGGFDKDLYVRVLRSNRLSPGDFENSQRESILVEKLQDAILAGVHVSESESLERYHFENDKMTLKFIKLDPSAFVGEVSITDDDTSKYFEANQEQFREPEKVRIEYLQYAPEKYKDSVVVEAADVQAYYDAHKTEFEKPEQVQARHILLKVDSGASAEKKAEVRKKAEGLLAKAKEGSDFAALAKENSEDEGSAAKGGDLGSFGRGAMVKPFEDAAFALDNGQVSDIVESQFGLHIIKVESRQEAHTQSIDEVRPTITEKLTTEKARAKAQTEADAAHAKAVGGESLNDLAAQAGLTVFSPGAYTQADPPPGIGRGPLLSASFATEVTKVGPVVDMQGGFYVFQVKEKIASRIPPLAEIKDKVEKSLRDKKSEEIAKTKAEAALVELQKSKDLGAVAKSLNATVDETSEFPRQGGYIAKIGSSPDLKKAAFQLTPEQPVAPAVYSVSGSSVLAMLGEQKPADEEKFRSDKDKIIKQAEERRKGQAMEEFVNYLKANAKVELNQDYLALIPDNGRPMGGMPRGNR